MADRIDSELFQQQGAGQVAINPATRAGVVDIAAEDGSASTVEAEIIALRQKTAELQNSGAFKGVVDSSTPLPTVGYKAGWRYYVGESGVYYGTVQSEPGDEIVAKRDWASGSADPAEDWYSVQANLDGAVIGPDSSVALHVAVFEGTSGKYLKDSGFTIAASVPANAKFTDTTYDAVTQSADGIMLAADKTKLDGVEAGADKTDTLNVSAAGAFMKATDTSDAITEGSTNLFFTTDERSKLSGIAAGAEVNQNSFAKVTVNGTTTITAKAKDATLKIVAGTGITITVNDEGDTITVSETYRDTAFVNSLDNVPSNMRDGGLIVVRSS